MTLPELLPSMRPVTLGDREMILGYLQKFPQRVCELSFTNFFLWGESRRHLFAEVEGHLIVSFQKDNEEQKFYQPIGSEPARIIADVLRPADGFMYEYVDEALAEALKGKVTIEPEPIRSDYVFALTDLRELKGNKYSPKRNFIKRCRTQNPEVVRLDSSMKAECLAIDERWLVTQPKPWPVSVTDEISALSITMDNFEKLALHRIGIRVNGRMEAIAIGAPLSSDTFLLSIQKASREVTGLYQLIFHEFAMSIPAPYVFLNFEEDMGLPALKQAKESWHPVQMVQKCRILA